MFYTYVLKSQKDQKLYIGSTEDLKDRVERHNRGQSKATRNRRPLKVMGYKNFKSRSEAVKFEYYLKSLKDPDLVIKKILLD